VAAVVIVALDAYLTGWLNLLIRWLHVIAAIGWIGSSFYFIALDNHLRPPEREEDAARGVGGESWEIHGGGFYRIEKFKVAPETLPEPLHWYKWEAYTTWLTGFSLLIVLYYLNASQYLVDPSVSSLSTGWLIAISIGMLVAAWVVYDLLCKTLAGNEPLLAAIMSGLVVLSAWGAYQLFSPRAAWIQVGAMLGTIMAANVFFVIIPAHWQLVRAKERGDEPDPRHNIRGKQRSVHNNYFTLPVVLAMISNHFAFAYGRTRGWLVLVALMALGALVRHFFNHRHRGQNLWWIPAVAGVAVVALAVAMRPDDTTSAAATGAAVPFARVQQIVDARCVPCHQEKPHSFGISSAPNGVRLDSPSAIVALAQAIRTQAVDTHEMPLGNLTHMTDAERALLGTWIDQGAKR
jgi:uncharacterized membrane protein